jgi:tetratricopeptide (TPR) repeat protein
MPSFDPTLTAPGAQRRAPVRFREGDLIAGRYRIVRFIAQGGMGEVYEAEDVTLGERIALKTVSVERSGDPRADEYFRRELLLARKVTHSNVCRLFDVGVHDQTRFLTMELLAGETLAARIRRRPLEPAEALPIVQQMTAALAAAHAVGIVHRDFKSHNVILVGNRAVVTDFGLARAAAGEEQALQQSDSGRLVGTPHYMAPEQVEGSAVGPPADVYALGVVLFEMMTGTLPFEGDTAMATAVRRLTTPPPSPRQFSPKLDARWEKVILACLAREPQSRPPGARAVYEQLTGEAPVTAPTPRIRIVRTRWLVAAAVLVTAGALALLFARRHVAPTAARTRPSVAILGFENRAGRATAAWLSTALGEMMATELSAGGELRTVPGESVARVRRELGIAATDGLAKDTLEKLRATLGVDYVVLGSYVEIGDAEHGRVRLDLRLQDTQSGEIALAAAETAPESELFDLVSRAGASLRTRLGAAAVPESETGAVRAALPGSADAARLYAEGLAHLRAYDFLGARDTLTAAIRTEPDFALSHAALAAAWMGLGHDPEARSEAQRALELGAHLPRVDRLLVEARGHEAAHEWKKAIDVWRSLFAFFPDQLEYGLGLAHAQTQGNDARAALETIASLRKLGDDARIDYAAADAYDNLSDPKHEQEAAQKAAQKARARGERILAGESLILEGWARKLQNDRKGAEASFREAESLFSAVGIERGVAQARHNLAQLQFDGDPKGAVAAETAALATFRRLGDDLHASWAENVLAIMVSSQGDLLGGLEHFEASRKLAHAIGATVDEGLATLNQAVTYERLGQPADSRKRLNEAIAIFRQVGYVRGEGGALGELADVSRLEGDLPAARREIDESVRMLQGSGNALDALPHVAQRCALAVTARDVAAAKKLCTEAQSAKAGTELMPGPVVQFAEIARLEGRADEALEKARAAARSDFPLDVAGARDLEARLLLARGDLDGAAKASEAALAAEKTYPVAPLRLELTITRARIEAARGHTAEARKTLAQVLAEAERKGIVSIQLAVKTAQ